MSRIVVKITLGRVIDRSFTRIAQYAHTLTLDPGSNLAWIVSLVGMLARASLKQYLPGSPGIETKREGLPWSEYSIGLLPL